MVNLSLPGSPRNLLIRREAKPGRSRYTEVLNARAMQFADFTELTPGQLESVKISQRVGRLSGETDQSHIPNRQSHSLRPLCQTLVSLSLSVQPVLAFCTLTESS